MNKPRNIYPAFLRRALKRFLPERHYARHFGRHERGSLHIWKTLVAQLGVRDTILDIGAFHGEYALAARSENRFVTIYAFEPNPFSAAILREKCDGLDIHLKECAVTRKSGQVTLSISSAMSHLVNTDEGDRQAHVQVRAISLDEWAVGKEMCVSLMKIDVEGAESDVLLGAKYALTRDRPVILCEVLSDEAGLNVMRSLPVGYQYYHIDENSGLIIRTVIDRKSWKNKNWLLVPSGKTHQLAHLV
jgi:FkbM family methyltransferase